MPKNKPTQPTKTIRAKPVTTGRLLALVSRARREMDPQSFAVMKDAMLAVVYENLAARERSNLYRKIRGRFPARKAKAMIAFVRECYSKPGSRQKAEAQ